MQARVLDLLATLQREMGLTYLFIAHDLAVMQQMSHDVLVMRDGEAVEYRPAAELFAAPAGRIHPRAAGRGSAGATTGLDVSAQTPP